MSSTSRSSNVCNVTDVDTEVFMRIEAMCKELRKEKDTLKESLFKEKYKNAELIQKLESNAMSEVSIEDKRYIEELERELRNCSLEIGYLQDQLNLRNVESNFLGEHVHSLELKLAEVGTLHQKSRLLTEALVQSNSKQVILMQKVNAKEEELQNSALQIEELETSISSIALESQCEIESMKLEITALEEKCFETERLIQQAAREKSNTELILEKFESQFQNAQERIHCLEIENKELTEKLKASQENAKLSYCKVAEHLHNWMKYNGRTSLCTSGGSDRDLLLEFAKELPLLKEICTCEEVFCPFVSNPAVMTALDDNVTEEAKMMLNQIRKYELQVAQLKEELKAEKLKSKEEAEDLTQEMAELRYQMTDKLEEECKRRASIEQASLRRIKDLEEQVRKEQIRSSAAIQRFQEVNKLAEKRALEVRHLKSVLEGFSQITDPETARRIESCSCVNSITSENSYESRDSEASDGSSSNGYSWHQASIGWYPEDEAPSTEVGGR